MNERSHRGSIYLEEAEILDHRGHAGNQFVLKVRAPQAAARATPGSFAHITCEPSVPMRRPLSIMRAAAAEGWIEFLYKPVGRGLALLAQKRSGESLSVLAPIGRGFEPDPARPCVLAIGGGVGIPPMIFAAEVLRADPRFETPVVLMGSELPFPFEQCRSRIEVTGMPAEASAGLTMLEAWGVPSRLASAAGIAGAFRGYVPTLAEEWLSALEPGDLARMQIIACGPERMLSSTANLAHRFGLPCQIALEEYMACGVGGCAGCTVLLQTDNGPAMKRVCVDGPVFDAAAVYPAAS